MWGGSKKTLTMKKPCVLEKVGKVDAGVHHFPEDLPQGVGGATGVGGAAGREHIRKRTNKERAIQRKKKPLYVGTT